jgi:general secretion pathway protein D
VPPTAQRYSIALIEGSSEAYMRSLMAQHPTAPLHLRQEQRQGQGWYRLFYGDYSNAELAAQALRELPPSLPGHRGKVVTL